MLRAMRLLSSAYHCLGDALAHHTTPRQRRSAAANLVVVAAVVFLFFPNAVWLVNVLSILALLGIVTGETPVESVHSERGAPPNREE